MEDIGILASIAEGAITLAGFAAVFRAFSGRFDPDGHSRVRLNSVIEGSLTVAFVCYLPSWLISADYSADIVWRVPSAMIVLWGAFRILVPSSRILIARAPLPELFLLVGGAGLIAIAASTMNVFGISPWSPFSTHLLAVVALFGNIGLIFVAQFRAEQNQTPTDDDSSDGPD